MIKSQLTRIASIITDIALLHPTNEEEERKKFFANENYNPQFTYKEIPFPLFAFKKDLEQLLQQPQDDDERISNLIQERVRELLTWLELQAQRGKEGFTDASLRIYGQPSRRLIEEATRFLKTTPETCPEEKTLTAQEIIQPLKDALKEEQLDWEVALTDKISTRINILKGKELRINPNAHFSPQDLKKIIIHEIKTHARRYKNGQAQPYDIFETGTAHFLETEEGLATYNEDQAGVLTNNVKRRLAVRVLAVNKALTSSFSDVYNFIQPFVGEDHAYNIALSVKRGLSDTSKPGAFTKPFIYFSGWKKIQQLSPQDRQLLLIGKISFLHLPLIKELIKEQKLEVNP